MQATTSTSIPIISSTIPDTTSEEDITTGPPTPTTVPEEIPTTDVPTTAHEPPSSHAVSEVDTETKSWPNEKYANQRKKLEQGDLENTERKPSVEAQHHDIKIKVRSAGRSNVSNFLSLFFGFFILACLI